MLQKIKNLFKQEGFLRYLKNTSWLMGEKILRIFAALFIGVWVARYLGAKNFGILSYAQSFVGIFTALSSLGLNNILIRNLVKSSTKKTTLLGTSFALQTIGSTALMICLITSIYINDNEPLTNKIIIILGLLTYLKSFGVIYSYFESIVKSKYIVIPSIIALTISSVIKVTLILNEASLIHFVYVLVFDITFLTAGQLYCYYISEGSVLRWKFSRETAKNLLTDSWPLILSGIIVSIYMKIDQVMIKELLTNTAVGQYAAAVRLSEAWYFIPSVISSSLFPAIINAKIKSAELYNNRMQRLYSLMVVLALSIILPTILLSKWLVEITYGLEYNLTSEVLNIHIFAGVFVFLGVASSKWYINENLQRYSILCLGLGMVVNIIMNLILIPKHGVLGAAYATLISHFISTIVSPLLFKKTRPAFYMMVKSMMFLNIISKK